MAKTTYEFPVTDSRADAHLKALRTTSVLLNLGDKTSLVQYDCDREVYEFAASDRWRKRATFVLESALDDLDDDTDLHEQISEELDMRASEHEIKINNGGIAP